MSQQPVKTPWTEEIGRRMAKLRGAMGYNEIAFEAGILRRLADAADGYHQGWAAAREELLPLLRAALPLMDADLEFKADADELSLIARIEEAVKE